MKYITPCRDRALQRVTVIKGGSLWRGAYCPGVGQGPGPYTECAGTQGSQQAIRQGRVIRPVTQGQANTQCINY